MKVIFKEVGQGDSIILHWREMEKDRVVLIDCNLKEDHSNPVLLYLQTLDLDQIDLIVLSHPHTDHFSGLQQICLYAQSNKLKINALLHTCYSTPQYLRAAVKGIVANTALKKLFETLVAFTRSGDIVLHSGIDSATREFDVGADWKLKFLAPYMDDYADYNKGTYKHLDKGTINRGDANLLSTVIKLYKKDRYILLTGDCTTIVFDKIITREFRGKTPKQNLQLVQVPHHGSPENYHEELIAKLNKGKAVPAVISVGQNDYGHPSEMVKDAMRKLGYTLYETNDPANIATSTRKKGTKLSMISTGVAYATTRRVCQDQVFTFE